MRKKIFFFLILGFAYQASFASQYDTIDDYSEIIQRLFVLDSLEGKEEKVKSWIEDGVDINQKIDGITALLVAVKEEKKKIVKVLLENKADVNLLYENDFNVLHVAAMGNSKEIVEILLKAGAKLGTKTRAGETAYDISKREGKKNLLSLLNESKRVNFD